MSFQQSREERLLILMRELPTCGVSFDRSEGRLNKKVYIYGGGSGRFSIKANIAKRINPKTNFEAVLLKYGQGQKIIENLLELKYFEKCTAILMVDEEELYDMLGVPTQQKKLEVKA